ncbi:MAG: hypothetical protein WDO70_10670 [Alphaproteobacteria bacterium]
MSGRKTLEPIEADAALTLRELCLVLGFMAVASKEGELPHDKAQSALKLANFMEEFCLIHNKTPSRTDFDDLAPRDDKFAVHSRMAAAIATAMKQGGECNPSDLLAMGFARTDIDRCWNMARALAQVMLNWTDA